MSAGPCVGCGRDEEDVCHSLEPTGVFGPGGHDFESAAEFKNEAAQVRFGSAAAKTETVGGVTLRKKKAAPLVVDGQELSGPDEIRLLVSNMNACREGFIERFTPIELLQLHRMMLASGWEFLFDDWTERQVREALRGKPPSWNHDESPSYSKRAAESR